MKSNKLALSAFFIAFGIILPMIFHMAGGAGSVFLPMHLPVLLSGFWLGKRQGFLVGLLTPVLSSIFTGMPPLVPVLPLMLAELSIYGFLAGYLYCDRGMRLLPALLLSMVGGRVGAGLAVWLLAVTLHVKLAPLSYLLGAVATGVPGILLQLLLLPVIVARLQNMERYMARSHAGEKA